MIIFREDAAYIIIAMSVENVYEDWLFWYQAIREPVKNYLADFVR